jgi:hypothetical protein
MQIGLTVGTEIDRLEATATGFDFAEFGLAEFLGNHGGLVSYWSCCANP